MKNTNLSFDSKLTKAQKEKALEFINKGAWNFTYSEEGKSVHGIYGPIYDKTYFTIETDGSSSCYGK